jgi:NAD(P)-dependent dehydrogenase (short-subunit alcohol dehydrogenase family)
VQNIEGRIMAGWTASDIPEQRGRMAVVTGTGGLGYETSLALARAGAEVIVAGRNPSKGAEALEKVRATVPAADIRFEVLDLASLASIESFATRLRGQCTGLDLLINNAGVMIPPTRKSTDDGFELQLGTNHLGHFALTAHLLPLLRAAPAPRVVTVSSLAAREGAIDFADLNGERSFQPMKAYAQSKLACLLFAFELHRRSEANGWRVASLAAHPGLSRTDLLHNGPGRSSPVGVMRSLFGFLLQPASQGALPTLFAATAPQAKAGAYYGPDRMGETRGHPTLAAVPPQALDEAAAGRLWQVSEAMTAVGFS